jgi:hypothetical protein
VRRGLKGFGRSCIERQCEQAGGGGGGGVRVLRRCGSGRPLEAQIRCCVLSHWLLGGGGGGDEVELFAQPGFRLILLREASERAPGKSVHPLVALTPSLEDAD